MPKKITSKQALEVLAVASLKRNHEFIIELVPSKAGRSHLRLKGLNGEIVMSQENVYRDSAIRIAARICNAGLNVRFKELKPTPVKCPVKKKPVKYPTL